MDIRHVYSIVAVVSLCVSNALAQSSAGLRVTVTETTIQMVNQAEISTLRRELSGKRFNDLSNYGDLSWRLSNIRVTSLGYVSSNIYLLSSGQIRWTCYINSITLKADWWGRLKFLFISLSEDGSLTARAGRTSLSVTLNLAATLGKLRIGLSSCSANVGNFDLDFSGSLLDGLLNVISDVLAHDIRNILRDTICGVVSDGMSDITADMKNIQTSLPIRVIGIPLTLDNAFTKVSVTSDTISTYHKAAINWNGNSFYSSGTSVFPVARPSRGISFDLSEDVVNNLLRMYVNNGKLDGRIDYNRIVKNNMNELFLTCKNGLCLGRIVPRTASQYPDRVLGMRWTVNSARLIIQNGQILGELTGRVNCSADSINERLPLFSARLELPVAFEMKFSGGTLSARAVAFGGHATIDQSNMGKVLAADVLEATKVFILPGLQQRILDMLNGFETSYKIELPRNVFIKDSGLSLHQGVVRLEADLCYKTSSCQTVSNTEWVGSKDIPKFSINDVIPTTTTTSTTTTTTSPSSTTNALSPVDKKALNGTAISGQTAVVFSVTTLTLCLMTIFTISL